MLTGSHHALLHDPCILLLLPCPLKCGSETDAARSAKVSHSCAMAVAGFGGVHLGLHHSFDGDRHHCTLPILQVQGDKSA